ncbi:MAG: alkaline shock response membrane anchor protein AmaP [Candidatus Saelkia tenebricola]|nr:alkaline shock response membrane anchor protein AmaP [Candidatus Saelkia tenebricola]
MKFRAKFVLMFFGLLYLIIGVIMIMYSAGVIGASEFKVVADKLNMLIPLDILVGIAGGVLIVLVVTLLNFVWSGVEAERNIAFKTEYGDVLVSLSAIEDYIRKILREEPDIKDIRTKVSVRKKGLIVLLKAVMLSEINIPTITERIQSQLRSKVQEMLGMEEPIVVKVYISKIGEKEKEKKKKVKDIKEITEEMLPPYREF